MHVRSTYIRVGFGCGTSKRNHVRFELDNFPVFFSGCQLALPLLQRFYFGQSQTVLNLTKFIHKYNIYNTKLVSLNQ